MWNTILNIILLIGQFSVTDRILTNVFHLQGVYYLIHSYHNAIIVYSTASEVYNSLNDYNYILTSGKNELALQYVFALHFYHILLYWNKFRFDDWLHHILMIGISLSIGTFTDSKSLLGYNLFFTTGLPGGIDYFLLFLNRNGWLNKKYEKSINAWLNTWIRSPGCISHATLTIVFICHTYVKYSLDWWMGIIVALLTYWNGQYFMRQVVENNAIVVREHLV